MWFVRSDQVVRSVGGIKCMQFSTEMQRLDLSLYVHRNFGAYSSSKGEGGVRGLLRAGCVAYNNVGVY